MRSSARWWAYYSPKRDACGTDMTVKKAGDEREWKAMYVGERHVWGFPHLFWGSCPGFAAYLAEVMKHHG